MPKVTLRDVATGAGVSLATASKVLHGRTDVGPDTRAKVLEEAHRAGYRPRSGAWPDEAPAPRSALVVLDRIDTMYSATVLEGVVDAANSLGVEVVVRFAVGDRGIRGRRLDALPSDGLGVVFVAAPSRAIRTATEPDRDLPVVAIDPQEVPGGRVMTVSATNWVGGKAASEHLLELGHTRIAWLGGENTLASRDRRDGYRAGLLQAGLRPRPEFERDGSFTYDSGRRGMLELLDGEERPTAVIAANDEIALGAMDAVRSTGRRIPEDVSVVGFDDTPQARWSTPQLTTVRQPLADMGRIAVSMLIAAAAGGGVDAQHLQVRTSLIERGSTAPVTAAGGVRPGA